MIVSMLPVTALAVDSANFTDVSKDDWYYKYVDFVTEEEYFVGTSDTTFSPEVPMTRAMFVVVLAALEGIKVDNSAAPFADVPANTWYSGAVAWAVKNGVVAGVGDNKFAPDATITREQMAVMMNAYVNWHSEKHNEDHKVKAKIDSFGDADKIASWAKSGVENCRAWGLIMGMPDGNFYPQNTATRAEVATVIYNLAWLVYGGGGGGTPTYYSVTYYMNDGTDDTFEVVKNIRKGKTHEVIDNAPTLTGYTFMGWNTKADGSGIDYDKDDSFTVTSDVELYAQWATVAPPPPPPVATYTVTYYMNNGTDDTFKVVENVEEGSTYEVIADAPELTGFTFDGWNTKADGSGIEYAAGDEITVSGNIDLYAAWVAEITPPPPVVPVDYIYNALAGAIADVKAEAKEQGNLLLGKTDLDETAKEFLDKHGLTAVIDKYVDIDTAEGYVIVGGDSTFASLTGVTLGDPNEIGDTEHPIDVVAMIKVETDSLVNMAELAYSYAVEHAADIVNYLSGVELSKAGILEVAKDIADKVEAETGIEISKQTIKDTAEKVADKLSDAADAAPDAIDAAKEVPGKAVSFAKSTWVNNFKLANGYVTGDIDVSVNDTVVTIKVDDETYMETSKKDAVVDLAVAIAKDLVSDITACTEFTPITEIDPSFTVDIDFSANAYAEDTDSYPYSYPVTFTMDVEGTALDNVEYQYESKGEHNVKFIVTEKMQNAYAAVANKLVNNIVSPMIKDAMNDALAGIDFSLSSLSLFDTAPAPKLDIDALINKAVDTWLNSNLTDGDMANSALLDYINGNADAKLDNEALYEMIDTTLTDAIENMLGDSIVPGGALAVEMAEDPEQLKDLIKENAPEAYEKMEELGLTDYTIAKTQDYLTESTEYSEAKKEEMKESVDSVITDAIDSVVSGSTSGSGSVAPSVDVSAYIDLLSQVAKLTTVDGVANVRLGNLATALRHPTFQKYIAGRGDSVVNRVADLLKYIPDEAAVKFYGQTVTESTLAGIRDAETTIEAVEALADVIDLFGNLKIASFQNGQDITVKYNDHDFTVGLFIDIK